MKRILLFLICLSLLLAPSADAALGSKGLIVNDGKEIVLQKGEKKWLFVRDGLTGLPVVKGLTFYSDNTLVVTVGLHSGLLRGNSVGTAHLTVVNSKGDCGYLKVTVTTGRKGSIFVGCILLVLFSFVLFCFCIKKRGR